MTWEVRRPGSAAERLVKAPIGVAYEPPRCVDPLVLRRSFAGLERRMVKSGRNVVPNATAAHKRIDGAKSRGDQKEEMEGATVSADNYMLCRKYQGKYVVTMEFASYEPDPLEGRVVFGGTPVAGSARIFDTFEEARQYVDDETSGKMTISDTDVSTRPSTISLQ